MNDTEIVTPNYWVIWMPTYIHHNFKKNVSDGFECDVSDDPKHPQCLKVSLDQNSNIFLTLSEINEVGETIPNKYKITLKYVNHSCNGLFVYECIPDMTDAITLEVTSRLLEKTFHAIIYNIKQLYHRHIFHGAPRDSDKDYHFRAYIPKKEDRFVPSNIKKKNNKAIKFYLNEFEYNFRASANEFERRLADFEHQENRSNNKLIKWIKDKIYVIYNRNYQKQTCLEECQKVIGETLYTNSIFQSKYLYPLNDDEVRKNLVNLENLKTFFYFVRDYYGYLVDNESKNNSRKLTIVAAWAGIVVSIVLGVFSILHSIKTSKTSADTDRKIQLETIKTLQRTDSISQLEIKQMLQQQKNHIDSIFISAIKNPTK